MVIIKIETYSINKDKTWLGNIDLDEDAIFIGGSYNPLGFISLDDEIEVTSSLTNKKYKINILEAIYEQIIIEVYHKSQRRELNK